MRIWVGQMIVWAHAFVIVWEGIKVAHVSALDPEAVTEGVSMVHDTCTEMGIKNTNTAINMRITYIHNWRP